MLRRFAWVVFLTNLGVILWGAFVRATGSGAGCGSHWPDCNGEVVPRDPSVETLIELTHRVTSGLALVLVLALFIAAFRARPSGHPMRTVALLSFVFILLEAAVGAGLVLLEYVALDQSVARVYWMGAHLINTFLLVALLALAVFHAAPEPRPIRWGPPGPALVAAALVLLLVGVSGAITALGDTLFPAGSLREGVAQDFAPTAHFLVRLRVWHPVSAVFGGFVVIAVAIYTAMGRPHTRRAATFLVGVFFAQLVGGFINLVLLAPVWMQLVHLLMADLTWIGLVFLGAEALCSDPLLTPVGPVLETAHEST